ncbi:MAG: hypothetical protein H0V70_11825 [Ktedonobacteraceae bacterium]|nr:hypothetical protein [Ktedonobacteraceae bacterium]
MMELECGLTGEAVTTVTHVNVSHLAATPLGQQVLNSLRSIRDAWSSTLSRTTNIKRLARMNERSSILSAF